MIIYLILVYTLLISVTNDLRYSRIPNIYILTAIISGLTANTLLYGMRGIRLSLSGMMLPVLIFGLFFYLKLIGAGDIKLFCAVGSLCGWRFTAYTIGICFILAGMISAILLVKESRTKSTFLAFYKDLKMYLMTLNAGSLPGLKQKQCIKLTPYIAIGAGLQMLLCLY